MDFNEWCRKARNHFQLIGDILYNGRAKRKLTFIGQPFNAYRSFPKADNDNEAIP